MKVLQDITTVEVRKAPPARGNEDELSSCHSDTLMHDHPRFIAVMAALIALTRQGGQEVPASCIVALRKFTNGEIKEAIRIIRKTDQIGSLCPVEGMVQLLRAEVMGKAV